MVVTCFLLFSKCPMYFPNYSLTRRISAPRIATQRISIFSFQRRRGESSRHAMEPLWSAGVSIEPTPGPQVHVRVFENQLLHTITAGSPPPDVAEAARALIQNCFTRRSASEWLIDHLPGPLLSATENLMTRRALAESASASSPVEVLTAISTPLPALVSSEAVAAPSEAVH